MGKGIKNRGSQIHKTKTKYNRKRNKVEVDTLDWDSIPGRAPTQAEIEDMMIEHGQLAVRFGDEDFGL